MAGDDRLFEVSVDLPPVTETWPPFSVERLLVQKTPVKREGQVKSVPYFAKSIAYDDIVRVVLDRERNELMYDGVVRESGHSTVRVLLKDDRAPAALSELLTGLGCRWETTTVPSHWAVDVPPPVPYAALRARLAELESHRLIEFEEGAISSAHRAQLT